MRIPGQPLVVALCLVTAMPAVAAEEIEQIRREIQELRSLYESRIQSLEERLQAAETAAQEARAAAAVAADREKPAGDGKCLQPGHFRRSAG